VFASDFHTTAMIVPARFSQASSTPGCFSKSKRIGFEALPQPICGAAGQTNGALNTLIRSAVTPAVEAAVANGVQANVTSPTALRFIFIFFCPFNLVIERNSYLLGNEAR
jgi:hypothetical protein